MESSQFKINLYLTKKVLVLCLILIYKDHKLYLSDI